MKPSRNQKHHLLTWELLLLSSLLLAGCGRQPLVQGGATTVPETDPWEAPTPTPTPFPLPPSATVPFDLDSWIPKLPTSPPPSPAKTITVRCTLQLLTCTDHHDRDGGYYTDEVVVDQRMADSVAGACGAVAEKVVKSYCEEGSKIQTTVSLLRDGEEVGVRQRLLVAPVDGCVGRYTRCPANPALVHNADAPWSTSERNRAMREDVAACNRFAQQRATACNKGGVKGIVVRLHARSGTAAKTFTGK